MGFKQTVIRFEDDKGKVAREVVHHTQNEIKKMDIFGKEAITFKSQRDGTKWIIHTELVVEIFIEEENPKYGTMQRIETLEV